MFLSLMQKLLQKVLVYMYLYTQMVTNLVMPTKNTLGVKNAARTKKGQAEKYVCEFKWGDQGLLLLMEFQLLIMITRPQNIER